MFTWDAQKAIFNYDKHGVPFEEAATAFGDPGGLDGGGDAHSQRERRFKRIGRSVAGRILCVVYTIRGTDDERETVRIISARQASRKERQAYARF